MTEFFGTVKRASQYLKTLKDDDLISIEKVRSKRSNQQNRFLWLYYSVIENETGTSANDLHEFLKRKLLPPEFITISIKGKKIEYKKPKSTTKLNKMEFADYMDKICALTGVPIPDIESYHQI